MIKVDVIIPTFSRPNELNKCLTELNKSIDASKFVVNVVVVDDKSSKTDRNLLLNNIVKYNVFKKLNITPIYLKRQYGYVAALNAGLKFILSKKHKSDYVVLMHDDVIVKEGWLELCIDNDIVSFSNKFTLSTASFKIGEIEKIGLFDEHRFSSFGIDEFVSKNIQSKLINSNLVIHNEHSETCEDIECKRITKNIDEFVNTLNEKDVVYSFNNNETDIDIDINENFEYVCFTTNENLKLPAPWIMFNINDIKNYFKFENNEALIKEWVKYHPNIFFKNKKISIFIDLEENIKFDLNNAKDLLKDNYLFVPSSKHYKCQYEYLFDLYKSTKITNLKFNDITNLYNWYSFPKNISVTDSWLLIRRHMDERCLKMMNRVWMLEYSHFPCDNIFINLIMWLMKDNYFSLNN